MFQNRISHKYVYIIINTNSFMIKQDMKTKKSSHYPHLESVVCNSQIKQKVSLVILWALLYQF